MIVLPPGPLPAPGVEHTDVDLGVRWRDAVLTRAHLAGPVRAGLSDALRARLAARDGQGAARTLRAFLDTWALAAAVDASRLAWGRQDPAGLPVLARAAELAGPPSAEWIRAQAGPGPHRVRRRGPDDLAELAAAALDAPIEGSAPVPAHAEVAGADLAVRRAELGRALATGQIEAVVVRGPIPTDPATTLALGEIRLEGRRQAAVERFGAAGLWATAVVDPPWTPAPRGSGARRVACTWMTVPGTPAALARGDLRPVVYLVWDAPHPAVAVSPDVAPILAAVARGEAVSGPLVDELVAVGALTG